MKRIGAWKKACLYYVQTEIKLFICILTAFVIGGIFAAVFALSLPEETAGELLAYLDDFFQNMEQSGADASALFASGMRMHIQNFAFLFFASVMVVGAPLVVLFAAVKGFMHGFSLVLLFRLYNLRAALFFLLGMLPHYLLLAPCYAFLLAFCLRFSLSLFRDRQEVGKSVMHFVLILILLLIFAAMGTLLQAYVEPILVRLIAGLFV